MNHDHDKWTRVIEAIPRIIDHYSSMQSLAYSDRLSLFTNAIGGNWILRLVETVGIQTIDHNRASWKSFYIDNLWKWEAWGDPRTPNIDLYLGELTGAKEFAFYAGMGFDGYVLALRTKRKVHADTFEVEFSNYQFNWLSKSAHHFVVPTLEDDRLSFVDKYYRIYGATLDLLFDAFSQIQERKNLDRYFINNVAAASLLFLCGGHSGINYIQTRRGAESANETIIICLYTQSLLQCERYVAELDEISSLQHVQHSRSFYNSIALPS